MAAADRCAQCVEMAKLLNWEASDSKVRPDSPETRSWCDRHQDRPIRIFRQEDARFPFMPWVMEYRDRRYSHHLQQHRHYHLAGALRDADQTIVKLFPRRAR